MYSKRFLAALGAAFLFSIMPSFAFALSTANTTEDRVRAYFWDIPVMAAIAKCESEFTQFNSDGSVLHGRYNHSMIGIFQIASLHRSEAEELNMDIDTEGGNMAYARYLYTQEGTAPWNSSYECWKYEPETSQVVTNDTKLAMLQKQIDSMRAMLANYGGGRLE